MWELSKQPKSRNSKEDRIGKWSGMLSKQMAPLHLIYPAFVSAIVLSSSHVVAMYSDDGYFDPRMITPKHFMTHEEVLEEEFYDSLREAELMRLRKRRRMQASGDDDGDGDDYTENPDDGGDGEVSFSRGIGVVRVRD